MRLIDLDKAVSICDEDNNTVIFANIENAKVKAIPIEWLKKYAKKKEKLYIPYSTVIMRIFEDWEAERGADK